MTTQFEPMVTACEENLTQAGGGPVGVFVADAGYWSTSNVTCDTGAEVLSAPMPATQGITHPTDPRIAQRKAVIEPLEAGETTVRQAAEEMGVSETWTRKLLTDHRSGAADPAKLRAQIEERLATQAGAAAYAKRKITVEPCGEPRTMASMGFWNPSRVRKRSRASPRFRS